MLGSVKVETVAEALLGNPRRSHFMTLKKSKKNEFAGALSPAKLAGGGNVEKRSGSGQPKVGQSWNLDLA